MDRSKVDNPIPERRGRRCRRSVFSTGTHIRHHQPLRMQRGQLDPRCPHGERIPNAYEAVVKPALDSTSQRANLSKSFFVSQPVRSTDRVTRTEAMLGTWAALLYRPDAVAFALFHDA
jgi:hypothetical protein